MSLYYLTHFFYVKLNFNLKIDPEVCTLKNLKNFLKKRVATLILTKRSVTKSLLVRVKFHYLMADLHVQ